MAFKVQVGPAQIAIHQGQTVLVTRPDGQVNWPSNRGLYFRDTRMISAWAIYANGELWDLLNGGAIAPQAARIFLTNRAFADICEVKGDNIVRRGHIVTSWSSKRQILRMTYSNKDFCREVIVRAGE